VTEKAPVEISLSLSDESSIEAAIVPLFPAFDEAGNIATLDIPGIACTTFGAE
jgi:hypothetical protein